MRRVLAPPLLSRHARATTRRRAIGQHGRSAGQRHLRRALHQHRQPHVPERDRGRAARFRPTSRARDEIRAKDAAGCAAGHPQRARPPPTIPQRTGAPNDVFPVGAARPRRRDNKLALQQELGLMHGPRCAAVLLAVPAGSGTEGMRASHPYSVRYCLRLLGRRPSARRDCGRPVPAASSTTLSRGTGFVTVWPSAISMSDSPILATRPRTSC